MTPDYKTFLTGFVAALSFRQTHSLEEGRSVVVSLALAWNIDLTDSEIDEEWFLNVLQALKPEEAGN